MCNYQLYGPLNNHTNGPLTKHTVVDLRYGNCKILDIKINNLTIISKIRAEGI